MEGASSKPTPASGPAEADTPPSEGSLTFRIQGLDASVTDKQLLKWLAKLCKNGESIQANSLASHNDNKAATVTFSCVPPAFQLCDDTRQKVGTGPESEVLIDSTFHGITPLYSGVEPEIE
jgi:hypothetical protein